MITKSVILRRSLLSLFLIVSLAVNAEEAGSKDTPAEKDTSSLSTSTKPAKLSAEIYEKEDSASSSFTARVNLIRETDVIEVFFEAEGKNKGPFLLKDDPNVGVFKERLSKSKKNKNQNVTVHIKDEVITNVELVEVKAVPVKKSDVDSVLGDILKK